ncbi:MAG: RNA pseudouridine synthase [Sphingobium sp.]|nr:RNA pseudouridine synthase [Sphingobium sp.]
MSNPKPRRRREPLPSPLADRVVFIDGEALVIDKPAGLPVDPPRDGSLSMENHLAGLTFGFARWPVLIHRLDRDTSGCLLLARNPKAAARFTAAFEGRTVQKSYLAVLDGVPDAERGTIDIPLGKTSTREAGWRMVPDPNGKSAVTHWQVLATRAIDGGNRSLVRFTPETGRTHQLRTHALNGLHIAILGDPVYRAEGPGTGWTGGLVLHARRLVLPRDGKAPVDAVAPIPAVFAQAGFPDAEALDAAPDKTG